jgi:hypothetical protein
MILSSASPTLTPDGAWLLVTVGALLYALAAVPAAVLSRFSAAALLGGFLLHGLLLVIDIGGMGLPQPGARLGFGPVLSMTVWLVVAVYAVESRLVPLPAVRMWLGLAGVLAVGLAALFPGRGQAAELAAGAAALCAGRVHLRPVRRGRAARRCSTPPSAGCAAAGRWRQPPGAPSACRCCSSSA